MAWQDLPGDVKWGLVPYTRGMGFEIGSGPKKTFPHFISVDKLPNTRLYGSVVQPDMVVKTVTQLPGLTSGGWDFVFAPFHPDGNHEEGFGEWWRLLKSGGHLSIYWPSKPELPFKGWEMVEDSEVEGGVFQVYRKLAGGEHRPGRVNVSKPDKTCAVVRLGAFGDLVQASSVFPALKAEGYHLTLFTAPRGYEVVMHDPHIDRFVIQDPDQIPIHELGDFWKWLKTKFTRFINLSESVEGNLLATPGRSNHEWPHALRHAMMDVNYLEMVHAIAEVAFPPKQKFYATEQEKAWAKKERQKIGGSKIILWTLSGSSIHKTWPYLDQIIARILVTAPDARVVLVGDPLSQMLEAGWENEPRVIRRSGVWTIRQTLAFIDQSDLLVGPETGVMNAAGLHPVAKVCTLSHSSVENLTKHWKNCVSLTPKNTACYPCHILHFGSEFCPRDEATGTSKCQADISADVLWDAVRPLLTKKAA